MDEKTIALVLGITGIISTLISSAMGLYFTAKARSSPLRELLFNKQLELMTQLVHTQELFRTFTMILSDKNQSNKEWAREELASQARIFFKAEHEGATILPTELWVEIREISIQMGNILAEYDTKGEITNETTRDFISRCAKAVLISRTVLGVDKLTGESIKLFASKKDFERLTEIEIDHFKKMYDEKNA